MSWRIFRDDMRILNEDEMKSIVNYFNFYRNFKLSFGSTRTKLSNVSRFSNYHAVIGTNTHASFHAYPQRRSITFNRVDMQLLNNMKQLVHDNLNPFLGLVFNEKEDLILLWKFCSRGTIQVRFY